MTPDSTILVGDARERLAELPESSVQCCVTSPPYWGLRVYAWGGNGSCKDGKHAWPSPVLYPMMVCGKCGATTGTLGLEETPELFIEHLVEVFRAVRRVLRPDGTLWLNLGDSYASAPAGNKTFNHGAIFDGRDMSGHQTSGRIDKVRASGLKPKDLVCIPWRVALALQADGWWLRSAMPWVKRSPMPESCTDRPTSALEYVFLLTPSPRYFFDMEAVRQKALYGRREWSDQDAVLQTEPGRARGQTPVRAKATVSGGDPSAGRAFRNTDLFFASLKEPHGLICVGDEPVALDVVSEAFKQAHFATFPRRLVEPMIKAGTSERGCCPECGAPWVRVVDKDRKATRPGSNTKVKVPGGWDTGSGAHGSFHRQGRGEPAYRETAVVGNRDPARHVTETRTVGWKPGCECNEYINDIIPAILPGATHLDPKPMPCTCLDPFAGAGTVGVVCKQLGRSFIGIELNPEYARMAEKRIANPEPLPEIVDVNGQETFCFEEM